MEKLVKYGIFVLLFVWVHVAFAQQVRVESPLRFLALGDSYTIGQSVPAEDRWPVQLAERLKNQGIETEELKIIAQTGWRTDNLLDAIAMEKPGSNYNLVSLLVGVNNQYQGRNIAVYPVEFRQLLNKAIEFCGGRKEGVFVLSIPDYGYTPFGASGRETISAEIDEYNRINREISSEVGVTWFDITPISREAISKPEYLAPDLLHPSGEMYARWVDLMFSNAGIIIRTTHVYELPENDKIDVYPNPATTGLNFFIPQKATQITIFNGLGVKVYHANTEPVNAIGITVSDWESGIYFYRVKSAEQDVFRGKLLVK